MGSKLKQEKFLFNDALNTFYLRLYGVRYMVKYHSDSKKGNPLPPHGLLFPISSKGSFICIIPQTGQHIPWKLKQLQDIAYKWYFITKLIVITVARIQFFYMWLHYLCLHKHQQVNKLYSGYFVISSYREMIIFVKMAMPIKQELP